MNSSETTILIILIFIMLFIVSRFNVLRVLSQAGKINADFKDCYIISYPKKAELHNKGEVFDIDLDEFFELNPKLKGKIPIEKREGIKSTNELDVKMELQERKKIRQKYLKSSKKKNKDKKNNV